MLLNYTVSEEDYIAFNIYHARRTPSYKRTIVGLYLLLPALLAGITPLVFMAFPNILPWLWLGIAAAASGVWMLTVPARFAAMIRRYIKKATRSGNEFTGRFSLELRDDGMVYQGKGEKNEVAYSRIVKVADDQGLTYLFLGALTAIVVPPEAFVHESQKAAFLKLLREKCPDADFA